MRWFSLVEKNYFGIREIAKIAGVSIATVSRVINSPEKTSEAVREKVTSVIEKYNYIPNETAKNLYSGTSNAIAIFVYDMGNPFYLSIIKELNRIAFENNYTLLICDAEDNLEREIKYYHYCKSIRVAGIIYTEGTNREIINDNDKTPIVMLDRKSIKQKNCYVVKSDHRRGMQLLVDYLYKLNHRKIGFIMAQPFMTSVVERRNSFLLCMENYGIKVPPNYIYEGNFSYACGVEAFDYYYSLPDVPTAVIASNDQIAQGFIMRANSLGVSIPTEISVCGVDAIEDHYFYPKITSYKQDTKRLAQTMFQILVNHSKEQFPPETILDVSISLGQSCYKIPLREGGEMMFNKTKR
jgi:DNA-binding LacI/PurR family transcriptional regulator